MKLLRKYFLICVWIVSSSAYSADLPNILWLTSEDHGPQMGCYGDKNAMTPNMDALATRGMIFKEAWSNTPCCAPARSAIISGMYPNSTGAEHMRSMVPLPAGKMMFPQFLRKAGYYCTNNVKEDYNLKKPGEVWDESSKTAHWKNRKANQSFFAIFNSEKSHEFKLYKRPHTPVMNPALVRVPAYNPDIPEVRRDWAQYYDIVSEVDADAGEKLRELEEAGLLENTIVFYYADHGSGMPRSKRWPSNSGLQVPFIVYFPKKWQHLAPKEYRAGGKSDRLISFVDLAPTMLSLAGIKPPDWMQGKAFAGKYQATFQPYLYGNRGRMDEVPDLVRSVTDGRYVYLRNYMPHLSQAQFIGTQFLIPTTAAWYEQFKAGKLNEAQSIFWQTPRKPEELYDLNNDPDEVHNLAESAAHISILEKLRKANQEHLEKIRDICILPEGLMHERSAGRSPYDYAQDSTLFPFKRIYQAAEIASNLNPAFTPKLLKMLTDQDGGVRYWAAMGFLMRGAAGINTGRKNLNYALTDQSPYVRIVAAQALVQYGEATDIRSGLSELEKLAHPHKNGILVSMAALTAIADLGKKAMPLGPVISKINPVGFSPDERFDKYIPTRIIPRILKNIQE